MLIFSTDEFNYHKDDNIFTQESSMLNLSPRFWNSTRHTPYEKEIQLISKKTGNSKIFNFTKADISHGEAYGWNYQSKEGIKLLIIND